MNTLSAFWLMNLSLKIFQKIKKTMMELIGFFCFCFLKLLRGLVGFYYPLSLSLSLQLYSIEWDLLWISKLNRERERLSCFYPDSNSFSSFIVFYLLRSPIDRQTNRLTWNWKKEKDLQYFILDKKNYIFCMFVLDYWWKKKIRVT